MGKGMENGKRNLSKETIMNLLTGRCKEVFAFPQDRDERGHQLLQAMRDSACVSHQELRAASKVCEIGVRRFGSAEIRRLPLRFRPKPADLMKKKSTHPDFDQTLELLRAHSFDVAPYAGVAGGMLVSKHGVGAVLVPPRRERGSGRGNGGVCSPSRDFGGRRGFAASGSRLPEIH